MHEAGSKDEQILNVHQIESRLKLEQIVAAKLMIVTYVRQNEEAGLTGSCELLARWL
jgi:hypothetical protein